MLLFHNLNEKRSIYFDARLIHDELRMGRVRQKDARNQINNVPSKSGQENSDSNNHLCENLRNRSRLPDKTLDQKCCSPLALVLKNPFVVLEDIGNNLSPIGKRIVLGDKTNKSPMSPSNCGQIFKGSPLSEQQNTVSHFTSCNNENRLSPPTRKSVNKSVSSGKISMPPPTRKSVNKIVSCGKISVPVTMKSNRIPENHMDFSDKCVYAKVQRETLKNRNMPHEEKLAQYEFEVDENEPVVKKKKKKYAKRKKKAKSNEEYYPPANVFKKILQTGVEQATEKIKERLKEVLTEQNMKSKDDLAKAEIHSVPGLSHKRIQIAASSPHFTSPSGKYSGAFMESVSPVARPRSSKSQQRRNVASLGEESELEISASGDSSTLNLRFLEKSPSRLSCPELNDTVELCTSGQICTAENDESEHFSSSAKLQLANDISTPSISTPVLKNIQDQRFRLSGITSASSLIFSPLSRSDKSVEIASDYSMNSSVNHPVHLNRRVAFVPRVSGGVNNQCNEKLAENWNVENCFGFEDKSEQSEVSYPLTDLSLKQRLRKTSPLSSTPLNSNRKKPNFLSAYFKRKRESATVVSHRESIKLCAENNKTTGSPKMEKSGRWSYIPTSEKSEQCSNSQTVEKLSSPATTIVSPFSNPLKQSKLDFSADNSTSPTRETYKSNRESPLLFKDSDDKTPVHFTEPARRSYVRSVRKKMRPLGNEWVEIDSESEEEREREHKHAMKKKKKERLSKQEEKVANQWVKDFNHKCEEIEDFELCVE